VLNAKFHASEAEIVAQAGRLKAVTVATNMAGRGTDIVLGGNPDIIADLNLRERGLDPVENPEEYEAAWDDEIERMRHLTTEEAEKVRDVGGLYVLGTERHDSRRIDNQLRGRSGRQGDPGESRFYLSLGDELMRRFNGAAVESIMNRLNLPDDVPIEASMVSRAVKNAQTQVESQNFEIRKNVLKYDEVMNQQRVVIYDERRRILEGEDITDQVESMIYQVVSAYVDGATAEGYVEDWDLDKLWEALGQLYPVGIGHSELVEGEEYGAPGDLSAKNLKDAVLDDVFAAYDRREDEIEGIGGEGAMRQLERSIMLQVLDRKWREHLYEMDYLKEGIGLRAMAQRDPLVEYQREGYAMFQSMMGQIKEESVGYLYNLEVEVRSAESGEVDAKGLTPTPVETQKLEYSAPSDTGSGEVEVRNDRGQVQKSATAKARQHAAEQEAPADAPRGAFGQKTGTAEDAGDAGNRAARRAAGKKK